MMPGENVGGGGGQCCLCSCSCVRTIDVNSVHVNVYVLGGGS